MYSVGSPRARASSRSPTGRGRFVLPTKTPMWNGFSRYTDAASVVDSATTRLNSGRSRSPLYNVSLATTRRKSRSPGSRNVSRASTKGDYGSATARHASQSPRRRLASTASKQGNALRASRSPLRTANRDAFGGTLVVASGKATPGTGPQRFGNDCRPDRSKRLSVASLIRCVANRYNPHFV